MEPLKVSEQSRNLHPGMIWQSNEVITMAKGRGNKGLGPAQCWGQQGQKGMSDLGGSMDGTWPLTGGEKPLGKGAEKTCIKSGKALPNSNSIKQTWSKNTTVARK